jgi:hypothetical protein
MCSFANTIEIVNKTLVYLTTYHYNNRYNKIKFSFMEAKIEFCCGMTVYENDFLLTFGFQDNASYLLKVPQDVVKNFCEIK